MTKTQIIIQSILLSLPFAAVAALAGALFFSPPVERILAAVVGIGGFVWCYRRGGWR